MGLFEFSFSMKYAYDVAVRDEEFLRALIGLINVALTDVYTELVEDLEVNVQKTKQRS